MTPERREVLNILAELSELRPDIRMGQWMLMFADAALGTKPESIYDVEDGELLPVMRRFLESRREAAAVAVAAAG
ncbi:MAG: hypothetical protein MUF18_15925 [Fimbriiglobus sp.]|jgi:hypothetical protein|nr:hypothetical protein [Fimbriiglobus sp.]